MKNLFQYNVCCESRLSLNSIAAYNANKSLVVLEPPRLVAWTNRESEEVERLYRCLWGENQVPGTTRGGARTKTAINNALVSGYVSGLWRTWPEPQHPNLHKA